MNYAEGQMIFTTHNLAPMDVLQKAKHSIDFLSPDSRITSWTSNGNYTAASLYRKGLIDLHLILSRLALLVSLEIKNETNNFI